MTSGSSLCAPLGGSLTRSLQLPRCSCYNTFPTCSYTAEGVCFSGPLRSCQAQPLVCCVVSTVDCDSGVVNVYDSLYKSVSTITIRLIASMVCSTALMLCITMMDVEKQSNGSDCGVLVIAYAFHLCSGLNPCTVKFDPKRIRHHLVTCLESGHCVRFPVLGG